MERFTISISREQEVLNFDVADYLHHTDDHCKFEVYQDGEFIASFEPDSHKYLHVCKNTGIVEEDILHLIADKLETIHH